MHLGKSMMGFWIVMILVAWKPYLLLGPAKRSWAYNRSKTRLKTASVDYLQDAAAKGL